MQTALSEFERLEASGVWRASPDAQRINVIVSLGEATLTIADSNETALTHWSLPAVRRLNVGQRPALFSPGPEDYEELELDDEIMISGIERVRKVVEKRKPRPGRLRQIITAGSLVGMVALGIFWLPDALRSYTASVLPEPSRQAIGARIMSRIGRVAGKQCNSPIGRIALDALGRRVMGAKAPHLIVLSNGVQAATHLPGGITLLNRALIEDYEEPDVVAGFILAEDVRRAKKDPISGLLDHAGLMATAKLLTTGELADEVVDSYAEWLLSATPGPVLASELLPRFKRAGVRSSPYAYALDLTGERTFELIEADPVPLTAAAPLLSDGDWVRLQGICGE